jgi:membrane protease YdiL (CAAX protease family)
MSALVTPSSSSQESGTSVIPQYGLLMILFMFAWPAAWFSFVIYVISPTLLRPDGTLPIWGEHLANLLGHGAELAVALIILRREGYRLTPRALRERINLRFPDKLWKWGAAVGVFVAAVAAVILLLPLETQIATALPPPAWLPDHPLEQIQGQSPDMTVVGNVLFSLFEIVVMSLLVTILSEELYYRAALQPKMRGVFGRWSWVANGVLFGLKHAYVWWRLPYLVPVGVAIAYIFGPVGSLPLSIFFHWLGNTI